MGSWYLASRTGERLGIIEHPPGRKMKKKGIPGQIPNETLPLSLQVCFGLGSVKKTPGLKGMRMVRKV